VCFMKIWVGPRCAFEALQNTKTKAKRQSGITSALVAGAREGEQRAPLS
jgi:hypothetical protein